jgi:hypothetical protein
MPILRHLIILQDFLSAFAHEHFNKIVAKLFSFSALLVTIENSKSALFAGMGKNKN